MKKKLLPYILGCSMAVAMTSLAAHAATPYHHVGMDITTTNNDTANTSGVATSSDTNANAGSLTDGEHEALVGSGNTQTDSHNEFTEYNDNAGNANNLRSKTFGTPTTTNNVVTWGNSALGNTRSTTDTIQEFYPVTVNNEIQGYRTNNATSDNNLAADLATLSGQSPFSEASNDDFDNGDNTFTAGQNTGVTDLETVIPEFKMTIPARTVLPLGATKWRLGNVTINGKYFVKPDKVNVTITDKGDLKRSDYASQVSDLERAKRIIPFTVGDSKTSADNWSDGTDKYFFQDGKHTGANYATDSMQQTFPHSYTTYLSDRYEEGQVSEINETHQVWLTVPTQEIDNQQVNGWKRKVPGKYTGKITFEASVVTTDSADMYTNKYPGEPNT